MKEITTAKYYDAIDRQSNVVKKSIMNEQITELFNEHYNDLIKALNKRYKGRIDYDVLSSTYLYLTYKYDPNKAFIEQYLKAYNNLLGAGNRGNKYSAIHHCPLLEEIYVNERGDISLSDNDIE